MQTPADYAVAFVILGALAIGLISMLIGQVAALWDWLCAWWREGVARAQAEYEPEPQGSIDIPHMNHVEPELNGSLNPTELVLNADEVAALARMIEHKMTAAKPSKSSTIQAGFGVSRGGSQIYQRASVIYDTLFGEPPPAIQYRRPDGSIEPPTHPVSGRAPLRTHPR